MLKPKVLEAIAQLGEHFGRDEVAHVEDGDGGAYVSVREVDLGERFTDETRVSWIGFRISSQHPFADIYPHFVRPDLQRRDEATLGSGFSGPTQFAGMSRDAIQVSRRSNRRDAALETALIKLLKVIDWIRAG